MSTPPVILAVDDDSASLAALGAVLAGLYDFRIVNSGEEALLAAPHIQPDLILLDVLMGGIDGFETCRQLKAVPNFAQVPVIFLTALSSPDDEVRCFEAGGDDFVSKPFHPTVLLARVRTQLQLKQYAHKMATLAMRDGLTGLYNRRHFDERLDQEWRACQRAQTSLCVLMIDIDHFKHLNDAHGHQAGDDALIAVARVIQNHMRRGHDLAARYGGEEFVCLLPNTSGPNAQHIAEQICSALRDLDIHHPTTSVDKKGLTASIGVACTTVFEGHRASELVAQADQRLYRAKAQGRNQVVANE